MSIAVKQRYQLDTPCYLQAREKLPNSTEYLEHGKKASTLLPLTALTPR